VSITRSGFFIFSKKDKNRCTLVISYLVKPVQLIKRGLRDMYMPRKKYVKGLVTAFSPFWRLVKIKSIYTIVIEKSKFINSLWLFDDNFS
jgi:hypothetical protein